MKFIEVSEEELEIENKKNKANVMLFVDSFIGSGVIFAEAIDDTDCYNNNNDFCRALNWYIKSGNYKLYVTVFMKNGKVYLKRVDI